MTRATMLGIAMLAGCSNTGGEHVAASDEVNPSALIELARFRDARALAVNPTGNLHVVDAASSIVVVLNGAGEKLSSIGGAGTGDYSLLDPMDVDPSNGLDLFIADMGNGRIQRLSADGEFLETIDVPVGDQDVVTQPRPERGRPLSVAVGLSGAIYAVEGERGVVLRWEGDRRLSRVLGLPERPGGALVDPVGIVVTADGQILVADRALGAVVVYDEFGGYRRSISGEASGGVMGVELAPTSAGTRLLVFGPRDIAVHDLHAGLIEVIQPGTTADLVGVAVADGKLFLLTQTRLFRME